MIGHHDKANILAFHPQTMSLLASAGYDGQIILWDISCLEIVLSLDKLDEPVCLLLLVINVILKP